MKRPSVEIVIPAYNEEEVIENSVVKLHKFLDKNCSIPWRITIFSNGSTDRTVEIGTKLSKRFKRVSVKHTPEKGKAKTYRLAWPSSSAQIVGFMDADLSTELDALPACLDAILKGKADIVIGNRFAPNALVERSFTREVLSRGYNILVGLFFPFTKIKDGHCGFKFLKKNVAQCLLPHIRDDMWFFDTEFLMMAEQTGFRIAQVPVVWKERKASKVKIARVVFDYFLNLMKLRLRLWKLAYF